MNVLILTPDAVGSTLLQRLLTIYMQFHDFDRPVINIHELTNGLEKYYSPEFGREIVSKRKVAKWGYHQSLEQIVEMLDSVDHYKTCRLAQYHIKGRKDAIDLQLPFYQYLDDNFFVIACRRKNLFEHALSMSLNAITKKLNVYNHEEKISLFADMYMNKVHISIPVFLQKLEAYKDYLTWTADHFNVGSVFEYDEQVGNIEKYILNLPIFSSNKKLITWKEKFNIDLNDWNRCHHIPSDMSHVALHAPEVLQKIADASRLDVDDELVRSYQTHAPTDWPRIKDVDDFKSLPQKILNQFSMLRKKNNNTLVPSDLFQYLPSAAVNFYDANRMAFQQANSAIYRMRELDILPSPPPIKKQGLGEKLLMIKNWQECLDSYNLWSSEHGISDILTKEDLDKQIIKETMFWNDFDSHPNQKTMTHAIGELGYDVDI